VQTSGRDHSVARGKPMAWTMTYLTAVKPGAASHKATQNKIDKYFKIATESAGMWLTGTTEPLLLYLYCLQNSIL